MSTPTELGSILQRLETFGVRLGLQTTDRLLTALGDPQKSLSCVLIAGTNGKGSTAALLAGMATSAGYRTGLYTSPHLESVEERLRIDGKAISAHQLTRILAEVVETAECKLGYLPTYFEALTSGAYRWFAEESVDLAVVEVGLGGRLDATNGAEPIVSLITEIGLDHQSYLGQTLAEIAREKAGIMRPGRRAIAWVGRPEVRDAIRLVADEIGADLAWGPDLASFGGHQTMGWSGQQFELQTPGGRRRFTLALPGDHQRENLALAVLAAEALGSSGFERFLGENLIGGVAQTRWPGRLEWVEIPEAKPVLLDVAHNPDGGRRLELALEGQEGSFDLLFGALADKEVERVLPGLASKASRVVLTSPASGRAIDPRRLMSMTGDRPTLVEPDRSAALSAALEGQAEFVLVCGSVYLVGDVRMELRRRFGVPLPATDCLFGD